MRTRPNHLKSQKESNPKTAREENLKCFSCKNLFVTGFRKNVQFCTQHRAFYSFFFLHKETSRLWHGYKINLLLKPVINDFKIQSYRYIIFGALLGKATVFFEPDPC